MSNYEKKIIEAALEWYNFVLKSQYPLEIKDKNLFNAILEYQKERRKSSSSIFACHHFKDDSVKNGLDIPTTPIPGPLLLRLLEESKEEDD